jgi:ribonuclease HII
MPDFTHEQELIKLYGGDVAGIDEVGYGAWAGPVLVCAAVINDLDPLILGRLDDSKKLTKKQREEIYDLLENAPGIQFSIAQSSPQEIDASNVLAATHHAMRKAIEGLKIHSVLVDGKNSPQIPIPCHTLIDGDQKSYSIAAASIIAKVTRDRLMEELHVDYPGYGWNTNVGYGTKKHMEGLGVHGVSPFHRLSYKPIQELLNF